MQALWALACWWLLHSCTPAHSTAPLSTTMVGFFLTRTHTHTHARTHTHTHAHITNLCPPFPPLLTSSFFFLPPFPPSLPPPSAKCVVENPVVTEFDGELSQQALERWWHADYWGRPLAHKLSHKSWRPLTTLSFMYNYHLSGLDPFPFHLVNVALHVLATLLVMLASHRVIGTTVSSDVVRSLVVASCPSKLNRTNTKTLCTKLFHFNPSLPPPRQQHFLPLPPFPKNSFFFLPSPSLFFFLAEARFRTDDRSPVCASPNAFRKRLQHHKPVCFSSSLASYARQQHESSRVPT